MGDVTSYRPKSLVQHLPEPSNPFRAFNIAPRSFVSVGRPGFALLVSAVKISRGARRCGTLTLANCGAVNEVLINLLNFAPLERAGEKSLALAVPGTARASRTAALLHPLKTDGGLSTINFPAEISGHEYLKGRVLFPEEAQKDPDEDLYCLGRDRPLNLLNMQMPTFIITLRSLRRT